MGELQLQRNHKPNVNPLWFSNRPTFPPPASQLRAPSKHHHTQVRTSYQLKHHNHPVRLSHHILQDRPPTMLPQLAMRQWLAHLHQLVPRLIFPRRSSPFSAYLWRTSMCAMEQQYLSWYTNVSRQLSCLDWIWRASIDYPAVLITLLT